MRFSCLRLVCLRFLDLHIIAAIAGAALLLSGAAGQAQNYDSKSGPPRQAEGEAQKKVDEFAEAAKVLGGPAANPECVWLGRRAVSLLWRDDLDTAFRHLELYDRFGCPAGHIQAAFRCLVRQGKPDLKASESISDRAHACWINPTAEAPSHTPSAAAPAPTTNR